MLLLEPKSTTLIGANDIITMGNTNLLIGLKEMEVKISLISFKNGKVEIWKKLENKASKVAEYLSTLSTGNKINDKKRACFNFMLAESSGDFLVTMIVVKVYYYNT